MFHFGGIIMDSQLTITCIRIINWVKDNLIKVNTIKPIIEENDLLSFIFILGISEEIELIHKKVEESSQIVVHGFGSDFTFVGRGVVLEKFNSCYENYYNSLNNNGQVDRDNVIFPFIAAAPGIGKSRMMKEIGIQMFHNKQFFPLFTSFGNATKFDEPLELNPINGLCIRIIYSLLCAFKGKNNAGAFYELVSKWYNYFGNRNVYDLQTILKVCKQLISPKEELNFFLGMEYKFLINVVNLAY
ncbi:predicted protein [Naegleria gruberi]|uniref:Predicted protein n=1 Tax=Naegleria gruberi TaxID=5762 RepID=D2W6R4_NAEGR|nr:uncharacterized protein NAEGRDRAFT_77108 [Naegleria gruberi]EFC35238.1 predicted protein [Naegleria gruberi]|eukprot:XP_002667982.1 predicted protein [Naegleria gruberi strain NEG-M]